MVWLLSKTSNRVVDGITTTIVCDLKLLHLCQNISLHDPLVLIMLIDTKNTNLVSDELPRQ